MVTPGKPRHRYTYAQYVALENHSPTKHEFFDGEIYAMAGGSEDHSALAARVLAVLDQAIVDQPGRVHTSDLRIYVEAVGDLRPAAATSAEPRRDGGESGDPARGHE
jgi:hypothetical protein